MEVVHHDFGLHADGVLVVLDVAAQLLPGPLGVELRVALRRLDQPVVAVHRRVVLQHVNDEAFLNRLLHAVDVEREMSDLLPGGFRRAEYLQRLALWGRREGEVAGVGQELLGLHQPVDLVLGGLVLPLAPASPSAMDTEADVRPPWLEWASSMMMPNRRPRCSLPMASRMNGNFCTVVMTIFFPSRRKDRRSPELWAWPTMERDLRELLDRVPDLLVEDLPVRDDDYRIEEGRAVLLEPDELVGKPRDGVRLAASGRVLDQVPATGAPSGHVRQELAHHVQLVVARPYLLPPLASGLVVLALDDLGVVLDDVGQPAAGERFLPQVVGLEPVGVRRVAAAAVPPPVEGQEPRFLALEVGAEPHLVVVHGEVGQAAPSSKSFSRGLRSRLYCSTASSTVCFVRLFFSSKVATGRPLMNRPRSNASCALSRLYWSWRVTLKRFCP